MPEKKKRQPASQWAGVWVVYFIPIHWWLAAARFVRSRYPVQRQQQCSIIFISLMFRLECLQLVSEEEAYYDIESILCHIFRQKIGVQAVQKKKKKCGGRRRLANQTVSKSERWTANPVSITSTLFLLSSSPKRGSTGNIGTCLILITYGSRKSSESSLSFCLSLSLAI